MAFAVEAQDGDSTSCTSFTINSTTGTKIWLEDTRIKGWVMVTDGDVAFSYSNVIGGTYVPITSGLLTGTFTNGEKDTIGWVKSQSGTPTLYVLFIY